MNQKGKIAFVKAELENIVFLKMQDKILTNVASAIKQAESYYCKEIRNSQQLKNLAKREFLNNLKKAL